MANGPMTRGKKQTHKYTHRFTVVAWFITEVHFREVGKSVFLINGVGSLYEEKWWISTSHHSRPPPKKNLNWNINLNACKGWNDQLCRRKHKGVSSLHRLDKYIFKKGKKIDNLVIKNKELLSIHESQHSWRRVMHRLQTKELL